MVGATDNIRSIMAYPCNNTASATPVARFASPTLVFNGVALGSATDNCARAISETATQVAAYKSRGEALWEGLVGRAVRHLPPCVALQLALVFRPCWHSGMLVRGESADEKERVCHAVLKVEEAGYREQSMLQPAFLQKLISIIQYSVVIVVISCGGIISVVALAGMW